MSIKALDRFREKYPGYYDRSDEELAGALAKKYPDSYNMLPEMVARDIRVSSYAPEAQRSAELATQRPDMKKSLMEEMQYNPLQNEELSGGQKATHLAMKPAALGYKALGAYGQTAESVISSPHVAAQRADTEKDVGDKIAELVGKFASPALGKAGGLAIENVNAARKAIMDPEKRGEFFGTIGRSISGEEPTEYGDVFRNAGYPEPVAASLGLVTAFMEPGMQEMVKGATAARRALGRSTIGKLDKTVGTNLAKLHLGMVSQASGGGREAVDVLMKNPKKVTRFSLDPEKVNSRLNGVIDTVRERVFKIQRNAGKNLEDVSRVYSDKVVPAVNPGTGLGVTDNVIQRLVDDAKIEKTVKGTIRKGAKAEGVDDLLKIIKDTDEAVGKPKLYGGRGNLTVMKVRELKGRLKSIASDSRSPVYSHANALSDDLTDLYLHLPETAKADFEKARSVYSTIRRLREGNKMTGRGSIDALLKASEGSEPKLYKYFSQSTAAKKAMQELDDLMPKGMKFMEELKAAAAANIFKNIEPIKGTSLLGLVTLLYRPQLIPGVFAAGTLTSPRLSALAHAGIQGAKQGLQKKPVWAAVQKVLGGAVDLGTATAPRRGALEQ